MAGSTARVTTIVPTFRRPALLARALDSVVMQSFAAYRVQVYDNASGDETADMVRARSTLDSRFEYHEHAQNIGSERNFQFGLDRVDTEYFSFLSDDDLLLPHLYQLTVAALDSNPDAAMAAAGVIHANAVGTFAREPSLEPGLHRSPEALVAMLRVNQPAWTGTLFRTALVKQAGGLDVATVIDLDLELRLAAHYPVVILEQPGAILMTEHHFAKCLRWSELFERTIRKLEADEGIPDDARRLVRPSLEHRLRAMVYQTGIVGSRMGRPDVTREASRILSRDYGDRRRSVTLSAMAIAGRLAPTIAPAYKRLRSALRRSTAPTPSETLRAELRTMAPALIDQLSRSPLA